MRRCGLCRQERPSDEFRINRWSKTGQPIYDTRCTPCALRYRRMYGKRHRRRLVAYNREYRAEIRTRPVLDAAYRAREAARMRLARKKKRDTPSCSNPS